VVPRPYDIAVGNAQLAAFTMSLASSDPPMSLTEVARWLRAHTRAHASRR